MLKPIFTLLICSIAFAASADECTFSQDGIIENLKVHMQQHPGGTLNEAEQTIVWKDKNSSATYSYAYGGCEDIGLMVKKNLAVKTRLTEAQVLAVAAGLAKNYCAPYHAKPFLDGIANKTYTKTNNEDGAVSYAIPVADAPEVYITYDPNENYISINLAEEM